MPHLSGRGNSLKNLVYEWENFTVDTNQTNFYLEEFGLSYIEILVSFKKTVNSSESREFSVTTLLSSAIGVALTNVDMAPIRLKGL